jgi:hypothetical protein
LKPPSDCESAWKSSAERRERPGQRGAPGGVRGRRGQVGGEGLAQEGGGGAGERRAAGVHVHRLAQPARPALQRQVRLVQPQGEGPREVVGGAVSVVGVDVPAHPLGERLGLPLQHQGVPGWAVHARKPLPSVPRDACTRSSAARSACGNSCPGGGETSLFVWDPRGSFSTSRRLTPRVVPLATMGGERGGDNGGAAVTRRSALAAGAGHVVRDWSEIWHTKLLGRIYSPACVLIDKCLLSPSSILFQTTKLCCGGRDVQVRAWQGAARVVLQVRPVSGYRRKVGRNGREDRGSRTPPGASRDHGRAIEFAIVSNYAPQTPVPGVSRNR